MSTRSVFYVTNRKHKGSDYRRPSGYGTEPSGDGIENLRFGKATAEVDDGEINKALGKQTAAGPGDGNALSKYLTKRAGPASLEAYEESIPDHEHPEKLQPHTLGSTAMFEELRQAMLAKRDVMIFVHGYNVSWKEALASALALQEMLNRRQAPPSERGDTMVVLFSWPSDGSALPFAAYKSDRGDAGRSGDALGRALLKLRDYLAGLRQTEFCWANMNILCHSMGNYVLQRAIARATEHVGGGQLPKLFDQSFLCSADVDDDVFSPGGKLVQLPQLSREVSIYTNRGDTALAISDYTKGHPKRLGSGGVALPSQLHASVHQIDCSKVVTGLVEHSYYLDGDINRDIRMSLDGRPQDDLARPRTARGQTNLWRAACGTAPGR